MNHQSPTSDQPAGESRYSPIAAVPVPPSGATGNGGADPAEIAAPSTVANFPTSPAERRARRSTGSAVSLMDRLQIFQQAVLDLQSAGLTITAMADGPDLQITLRQIAVIDGDLAHTGTLP